MSQPRARSGPGPREPDPAAPSPASSGHRPFEAGERALLFDSKGRRYLVSLENGGEFHTHAGTVPHDIILGQQEGTIVRSSLGARYIAVRPTLAEIVLKMPRGAQVIYPKDLGQILVMADISPGSRVLEAGFGFRRSLHGATTGWRRHRRLRSCGTTSPSGRWPT